MRSATSRRSRAAGLSGVDSNASTGGSAARRTTAIPTSSTTTTQIDAPGHAPRTATTWPTTSPTRPIELHPATPRSSTPTSRSSCTSRRRPGTRRTWCRSEWADKYKGVFDEGYEAIRGRDPRPPDRARLLPEGTELSRDQPARRAGADRSRRSAMAAARHRPAVGLAQRRRAASVRPHGRGLRRLHLLLRRPARPASSTTSRSRASSTTRIVVVVSDNGASGEGGPNGSVQRMALLQRRARHDRGDAARTSTSSARRRRTTTTTPGGPGRSTRRSPTGSGGRAPRAASPTCASSRGRRKIPASRGRRASSTSTPSTSCPTIYDLLGITPPDDDQGLPAEPDRRRELRRRAHRSRRARQGDPVLHDARTALDLPRGVAGLHRAPAAQRAGASSSSTSGSCYDLEPTGRSPRTSPPTSPSGSRR